MPRRLRYEYPGALYHVLNRGDRREEIFKDDVDRERFLGTLGDACRKAGWQVHAYCLMRNHFHLVIETPQANLVAGMKWLLSVYTTRFNIRHKVCGHLFAGRYKAMVVDGSGNGYLKTACDYVHLNPLRAGLLKPEEPLESFRWSSLHHYLSNPRQRPPWLRVDRLFGEMRIPRDSPAGRLECARQMEWRRLNDSAFDNGPLRSGSCLGSEEFRRELLAASTEKAGPAHYGSDRQETGEAKAERIIREGLEQMRWQRTDLAKRAKGDPGKVRLAKQLRQETTMTLKWIAQHLEMGASTHVANLLGKV